MRLQTIASVLAAGCASRSAPPATPPTTPQPIAKTSTAICAGPLVTVRPFLNTDGLYSVHVSAHPEIGPDNIVVGDVAVVRLVGDINGDGVDDLALSYTGTCRNERECVIGAYIYCAPGKYAVVVPPSYFYYFELGGGEPGQWVDLLTKDRIDQLQNTQTELVFDGTRYRRRPPRFPNG
jgi:hypothetical protein